MAEDVGPGGASYDLIRLKMGIPLERECWLCEALAPERCGQHRGPCRRNDLGGGLAANAARPLGRRWAHLDRFYEKESSTTDD